MNKEFEISTGEELINLMETENLNSKEFPQYGFQALEVIRVVIYWIC